MFEYIMRNPILFYSIFAVICLIFLIVLAVIINKARNKKERKKLKKTSDSILTEHFEPDNEPEISLEKAIAELEEKAQEKNPENLVESFTNSESEKNIVQEPVLDEKVVEEKEYTSSLDIESVLSKMKQDLTKKDENEIFEFEKEQEESAIISYRELLEANGLTEKEMQNRKKAQEILNIKPQHELSEELEVLDIAEIEDDSKKTSFNIEDLKSIKEVKEIIQEKDDNKKFKMTEFISPIYGRIEDKLEYPTIPNISKTKDGDIKNLKNEDFLNALKAFRGNL